MPLEAVLVFGALAAFTYAGYPLAAFLMSRLAPRHVSRRSVTARVSIILPVYNEGERLLRKVRTLIEQNYPRDLVELIVVDDGSSDGCCDAAAALQADGVTVLRQGKRSGKAAALNAGIAASTGDIVLFTDARQTLAQGALRALVSNFADDRVAAVTGRLVTFGRGADGLFRRYEESLRRWESAWGSCAGATGALYAVRRDALSAIPEETILDDFVISVAATRYGRLVYEPAAAAVESSEDPERVWTRRIRTLAGNWQILMHPVQFRKVFSLRATAQVFCHKFMRLFFPLFAAGFVASAASWLFELTGVASAASCAVLFAAVALWGLHAGGRPAELMMSVLVAPVAAFVRYLRGLETVLWAR